MYNMYLLETAVLQCVTVARARELRAEMITVSRMRKACCALSESN